MRNKTFLYILQPPRMLRSLKLVRERQYQVRCRYIGKNCKRCLSYTRSRLLAVNSDGTSISLLRSKYVDIGRRRGRPLSKRSILRRVGMSLGVLRERRRYMTRALHTWSCSPLNLSRRASYAKSCHHMFHAYSTAELPMLLKIVL